MPKSTVGKPAFHVHHHRLMECLIEPIKVRQAYIRRCKPASEREVRLRLLRLVKGSLPAAVVKTLAALNTAEAATRKTWAAKGKAETAYITGGGGPKDLTKARAAWEKAGAALGKAWDAYDQTLSEHAPELETLHQQECPDCPWDGKTIFPGDDSS